MTEPQKIRRAIYPGTFDPPHRGHVDLIRRGSALVDELVIAVSINRDKQALFTDAERVALLERCLGDIEGVRVIEFGGLVIDLVARENADFLLRGIRTFSDFEAELGMAYTNRQLAADTDVETVFVLPRIEYSHYSSRRVKEVASFGGPVTDFLPAEILDTVEARLRERYGPASK